MIGILPRRYGLTSKQEEHGMPASSQVYIGHCYQYIAIYHMISVGIRMIQRTLPPAWNCPLRA